MPRTDAILVAAGEGRRMGGPKPKAFLPLAGRPLLAHSLELLAALPEIRHVVAVVPMGEEETTRQIAAGLKQGGKIRAIVPGGARRQDSVRMGLDQVEADAEVVLIHDAARPFATPDLIRRVIDASARTGAAIPGVAVADTLKRVQDGRVEATIERRHLVAAQTPQGFKYDWLKRIYQQAWEKNLNATDDAGLAECLGMAVAVVDGEIHNFKLTTPQDLAWAEILMKQRK